MSLAGLGGCWKDWRGDYRRDYFKIRLLSVQAAITERILQTGLPKTQPPQPHPHFS